jgi:hypothetical protein
LNPAFTFQDRKTPRGVKRHFTITLDPELAIAVQNFADTEGFSNVSEATRGLIRVALASTPEEGWIAMWRARAYNEVRTWALSMWHAAASDIGIMFNKATQPDSRGNPP